MEATSFGAPIQMGPPSVSKRGHYNSLTIERGQYRRRGTGPFPSREMVSGPFTILGVAPFGFRPIYPLAIRLNVAGLYRGTKRCSPFVGGPELPMDGFKVLFHFLRHILIAAVLFMAVAGIAILLWYATVLMERAGVPDEIRVTCYYLSELLFWLDVGCLVIYVIAEVVRWLLEIVASFRGG